MTYYEELGVTPGASAEEIRHSYRTLARLVHPDRFQDESVKRLAELQMRRLNQILSTLTDPEERRRYDLSLRGHLPIAARRAPETVRVQPRPGRTGLRRVAIGLSAWLSPVAAAVLLAAGLIYYNAGEVSPIRAAATARIEQPSFSSESGSAANADRERLAAELRLARMELQALRAEHQEALALLASYSRSARAASAMLEPRATPYSAVATPASDSAQPARQREP